MSEVKNVTYSILGQPAAPQDVRVSINDKPLQAIADALSVIAEQSVSHAPKGSVIHVSPTPFEFRPVISPADPAPIEVNVAPAQINVSPTPIHFSPEIGALNAVLEVRATKLQMLGVLSLYLILAVLAFIAFVLVKHYPI